MRSAEKRRGNFGRREYYDTTAGNFRPTHNDDSLKRVDDPVLKDLGEFWNTESFD